MLTIESHVPASSVSIEDAYPLSRLQAGMLFHSAYSPETSVYHDIFSFHLRATLDIEKLHSSVQEMTRRHPVLRTSFDLTEFSEPLQLVQEVVDAPLQVEDLRGLTGEEQASAIGEWAAREQKQPFDFQLPPLYRVQVHRRSAESFQFSFSFHHSILDGWSVAVLLTELFQHYLGQLNETPSGLADTQSTAFQQFIALERMAIESTEQRNFWEHYLAGAAANTIASWPVQAKPEQSRHVVQHVVSLTPELSGDLKNLANSVGVPLKSVLLAAHVCVMKVVGGSSDVVTGVVTHGRGEEGDRAVGLFLNTLPQRMKLHGGTWRELVRATYESEQELISYRHFPLVEIQKIKGGHQLFQSAFYFVHFHVAETLIGIKGLEVLSSEFYEETNFTFVASFSFDTARACAALRLIYEPNLLSAESVKRIGDYYMAAFTAMSINPAERYEATSLLSETEQRRLKQGWNPVLTNYPKALIHELFEGEVEKHPDAPAIVFKGERLTYRELNERANRLAMFLRKQGVGPDVIVGLCMERSLEMIVALLGILKAGGAYLPMDPDYPADRLKYMVEDSGVALILSHERLQERVPKTRSSRVWCLDRDWDVIQPEAGTNAGRIGSVQNLAYVVYTSGSTGRPKGVMVTHDSVANFLHAFARITGIRKEDVFAAVTTLSFDIAGLELYLPLITGARVLLVSRETARDAHEMQQKLTENSVTMMQATPSTWTMLVEDGWLPRPGFKILCGGEAISRELAEELSSYSVPVWNLYGPTETTIWSCAKELKQGAPVTLGMPIANTQVFVLDQHMQLVPTGVAGELYIGGSGLARGYLNRPELTAERFLPNPFSSEAGSRIYRTGDLVRFSPEGEIEFLGRVDQQVKIRGFRIELGEIEAELNEHQSIRRAVVTSRASSTGAEQQLVAYLVPERTPEGENNDAKATAAVLREYLATRLPEYMIPHRYVFLEEMPLTPNGKIDRQQLPAPDPNQQAQERPYMAPRTKIEEAIADICKELLGVEKISITDSFFELGGDSLLVSRLGAKIHKLFEVNIPIKTIFLGPSVQKIAAAVKSQRAKKNDRSYIEEFLEDLTDEQVEALFRETGIPSRFTDTNTGTDAQRSNHEFGNYRDGEPFFAGQEKAPHAVS